MSTGIIFPPEIIEEILYRLPVKSLGRFKCVSKPWQTLISTPKFIRSHLNHSRRHLEKLLVASGDGKVYSIDLANQSSLKIFVYPAEATELQFLPQQILWDEAIGFCNGLVMVTDTEETSFLINPTTGEYAEVGFPEDLPEESDFKCEGYFMNGLGYDTKNDDYKVVVISYYDVPNEEGIHFRERLNIVYSFRSNTLREVTAPPRHHAVCKSTQGVYLDGRIHWICTKVSDSSEFIAAFSLESEEFEEVEIPSSVSYANVLIETLVAVNGSLCFSVREDDNVIEVWVMKEYGVTESWKKYEIYGLGSSTVMPLTLMGDQEVVLHVDWGKYVVYNIEEKTLREIEICGISSRFELWGTYVESLISPNDAVGLRED